MELTVNNVPESHWKPLQSMDYGTNQKENTFKKSRYNTLPKRKDSVITPPYTKKSRHNAGILIIWNRLLNSYPGNRYITIIFPEVYQV